MTYKILITNEAGITQFATHKVEIKESTVQTINGVETIVQVGTGKYKNETFASNDKEVVKAKYIELLDTYKKNQLNIIADVNEEVVISVTIPDDEPFTPSI